MYSYQAVRPQLFSEEYQAAFIKVRDNAKQLLDQAGAFMSFKPFSGVSVGNTDIMLAMLDRMVELGDIREVTDANVWGQHRVFVAADR